MKIAIRTPSDVHRLRKLIARDVNRLRKGTADPSIVDELLEGLLPYITEPADRTAAREALQDASPGEIQKALLDAISHYSGPKRLSGMSFSHRRAKR